MSTGSRYIYAVVQIEELVNSRMPTNFSDWNKQNKNKRSQLIEFTISTAPRKWFFKVLLKKFTKGNKV